MLTSLGTELQCKKQSLMHFVQTKTFLSNQIRAAIKILGPFRLRQSQSSWFLDFLIFSFENLQKVLFHLTLGMTPDGSLEVRAAVT